MKLRRLVLPWTLESFIDYRKDRALLGNENQPEVPQAMLTWRSCQGKAGAAESETFLTIHEILVRLLFEASIRNE